MPSSCINFHLIPCEEGPAREDKTVSGQRHDVGWRINANDVTVLWRGRKRGELQTAMGQKVGAAYH